MVKMTLRMRPEKALSDVPADKVTGTRKPIRVILVPRGLKSGRSAVVIRLDLENGETVIGRTTASLFLKVSDAIRDHLKKKEMH
jgi:hypothetical protein